MNLLIASLQDVEKLKQRLILFIVYIKIKVFAADSLIKTVYCRNNVTKNYYH